MPKRRTSTAEDIIDITSWFPWWVGCLLAVISFAILHYYATIEIPPPIGAAEFGQYTVNQFYITLARLGQYVLPALFLLGSLVSLITRTRQSQRYERIQTQPRQASLNDMSWQQFEGLVAEFFRRRGYTVQQTGGDGADGGVDLVARKEGKTWLVQCKQWKALKVGVQPVRELYGVVAAQGATGGFVITSGEFSEEAKDFARGLKIELVNGTRLHQMIREVAPLPSAPTLPFFAPSVAPSCPRCNKPMVKRTARKGDQAGKEFWGCTGYPACRGTQPA